MRTLGCSALRLGVFLTIFAASSALAQTPTPTPDSIEKMFGEELDKVRGIDETPAGVREHQALIEALLDRLTVGDENQRYEAGVLLERESRKEDLQSLNDFLREHPADPEIKTPIIRALGATGDPKALDTLRYEFNQGNVAMQLAIIDSLTRIKDDLVINMLQDILLSGDNLDVHIRAIAALGRIGGDRAVYVLNAITSRLKSTPIRTAIEWALRFAAGDFPKTRTDTDLAEGRQQNYYLKGKQFYLYRPAFRKGTPKESWLIVCIHGRDLNYSETIDLCHPLAKQLKASLLVPYFDPINFPDFDTFNLSGPRSDKYLLELLEHVGEYGEIRNREIYLLGFGKGGDFAQRFTYFYPDRIARAAFPSTFFYPLAVNHYFPAGLKSTPLAPDLKIDLLKVLKTDFAFILDPYQGSGKEFKALLASIQEYTSKSQRSGRIRVRRMTEKGNNNLEAFNIGKTFLFPKE